MKKTLILSLFLLLNGAAADLRAQKNALGSLLETTVSLAAPRPAQTETAARLKGVSNLDRTTGAAFAGDAVYLTNDGGANWNKIVSPKTAAEKFAAVDFVDRATMRAVVADAAYSRIDLLTTRDAGASWTRTPIPLNPADAARATFETVELNSANEQNAVLKLRLESSSNFVREAIYRTADGGQTWQRDADIAETKGVADEAETDGAQWRLVNEGTCAGFKTECVEESKVFAGTREITPAEIKTLNAREKSEAELRNAGSVFAAPGGAVRTSLNRGFDKCTASTVAQMQTWWDNSPFYDANIYISGRNRGCSQPQLTAAWVDQVSKMGWGLVPTIVGYQSPCTASTTSAKLSYDPVVAEQQGRGEADIAITDAGNLGLTQGTVLYYDMERYDEIASTPGCRTATVAFLKGWTERVKERGYVSGTYGSPTNAVADWVGMPEASRMTTIWMARWDNNPSVWTYASPSPAIPTNVWSNLQRIKQYQAPHNETWGGVTFNIDGNKAEGPVAGIAAAKNKAADFDGDGKTDLSVFRPDTGTWFTSGSQNNSFGAFGFGAAEDIIVPGDYDGNGKTDYAVYRPSNGVWYIQTRAFSAQQFGAAGDIPVPGDYNGDGFTDIAVYRPSTGNWFIWNSSGVTNFRSEQFGAQGDKPVPGDYDADGKTDLAVFRPSDGVWYVMRSTAGFTSTQFGAQGDKPVPGDYDADGKTDLAVYRGGNWYLLRSTAGFTGVQFGIATDVPVPGDYDGDGKFDIAVYRDGNWYLMQSAGGFVARQFGVTTDRPVPAGYVPQ